VKEEFREILKKGQEITKAKFAKVREDWWNNLRTEITLVPIGLKQVEEECRAVIERHKEFEHYYYKKMKELGESCTWHEEDPSDEFSEKEERYKRESKKFQEETSERRDELQSEDRVAIQREREYRRNYGT
jgi:hypothetical protein